MKKKSIGQRILDTMEKLCSKMPPPGILFLYLFLFIGVLSCVMSMLNVQVYDEGRSRSSG